MEYSSLRLVHQTAVLLSVAGFAVRAAASFAGAAWVRSRLARTVPHLVDTLLLVSGLTMAWMIRLTPGNSPWLVAKLVGLLLYIAFGVLALRQGRPPALRAAATLAALATVAWIVSVAISKNPLGYFAPILHLAS